MAHRDTREEAARQIQLALEGALQIAAEQGINPPGLRWRMRPDSHVDLLRTAIADQLPFP